MFTHATLSLTINETLKWLSSLPILMQESFWWWQCSDRYLIPPPPPSASLISHVASVDIKHHVYLITPHLTPRTANLWTSLSLSLCIYICPRPIAKHRPFATSLLFTEGAGKSLEEGAGKRSFEFGGGCGRESDAWGLAEGAGKRGIECGSRYS